MEDHTNGHTTHHHHHHHQCAESEDKHDEETTEHEWIDVLVELLLNLFSINKTWIRSLAKVQFRKIFPLLSVNSVKIIVDV